MTIETVDQAYEFLKNKKGYHLVKIDENHFQGRFYDGTFCYHTGRELIKIAKEYSSYSKRSTTIKKNVKHFSNSKNRTKTRDILVTEEFDKLPSTNDPVAEDDIWSWD